MEDLKARIKKLEEVVDANAQLLMFVSSALNLCCKQLGVTHDQVFEALADEITQHLKTKRVQPENAGTDGGDSGREQFNILHPESGGDNAGSEKPIQEGSVEKDQSSH